MKQRNVIGTLAVGASALAAAASPAAAVSAFAPPWASVLSSRGDLTSAAQSQSQSQSSFTYNPYGVSGPGVRVPANNGPLDDADVSPPFNDEVPVLDEWRLLSNGAVVGTVSNHAVIDDGDVITTSPLLVDDTSACAAGAVVTTMSGSNYRLGLKYAPKRQNGGLFSVEDILTKAKRKVRERLDANAKNGAAEEEEEAPPPPAKDKIIPTGSTVGDDGRYILVGESQRSTSGKSQIFSAYRATGNGKPMGEALTIKISSNREAMERESANYDLATHGLFQGLFMTKVEFLPQAGPNFRNFCALVIKTGKVDLKGLLTSRSNAGLDGKAMRNAAYRAAKTVQAMHAVSLVWTDLKAENFVLMPDSVDMDGMVAIDLESAIPRGEYPVDYSPEACPPEFARAFVKGEADEFIVDYSYDVWSFGMLMYELSTGEPYFAGKSPADITRSLTDEEFRADVRKVGSAQLRGLVRMCLQNDPDKRPGILQLLLHPYFLTSGFGRISF